MAKKDALADGSPIPLTASGKPCKTCKRLGRACPLHHRKAGGPRDKLTRPLIQEVVDLLESHGYYNRIWKRLSTPIGASTWYRWTQKGREDQAQGKKSLERELWDAIAMTQQQLEGEMEDVVLQAARGNVAYLVPDKDGGETVYHTPPDPKVALTWLNRRRPGWEQNAKTAHGLTVDDEGEDRALTLRDLRSLLHGGA